MTPTFPQSETNTCVKLIGSVTDPAGGVNLIGHAFVNTMKASPWIRLGEGIYRTLTGTTWIDNCAYIPGFGSASYFAAGTHTPVMPLINNLITICGYYTLYPVEENTRVSWYLKTFDETFVATDLADLIGTSTLFLPEMVVYSKTLG